MIFLIPISKSQHATFVSSYAPALNSIDEAKAQFYEDLSKVVESTCYIILLVHTRKK